MKTRNSKSEAKSRFEWRPGNNGTWKVSLGGRGHRVRLFQKRSGGEFYRAIWLPDTNKEDVASLQTSNREEAYRLGSLLVSELLQISEREANPFQRSDSANFTPDIATQNTFNLSNGTTHTRRVVKLAELGSRYLRECAAFQNNQEKTKSVASLSIKLLIAVLGANRDVQTISPDDLVRYSAKRRAGGIVYIDNNGEKQVTSSVRQRCVHTDLGRLRTMLRWACTVFTKDGQRLITFNPVSGMRFQKEQNPVRPITSRSRYRTTRRTARLLSAAAATKLKRLQWIRLELALFIAYHTARRRGAIAGLRWDDFDLEGSRILWRSELDKKKVEWRTPMPRPFMWGIRFFQQRLGSSRGALFPCDNNTDVSVEADRLSKWLLEAETAAGLPKLKGGLWHPYRRRWASDRMHLPVKAVADAGGWKDVMTLMTCYQQTDEATLLEVMRGRAVTRIRV